jgi:carbon monoxide dehydrogenase subunit G
MEHEVFVPVPAETVRQTLADPGRVARCLPGWQRDADASAGPLAGRLKFRVGGHTITYRGGLRIAERDGAFAVEGEGTEARGAGAAKLAFMVRLTQAEGGTALTFSGSSRIEGRLAELPADAVAQAVTRLLDRFAASLASLAGQPAPDAESDLDAGVYGDAGGGVEPDTGARARPEEGGTTGGPQGDARRREDAHRDGDDDLGEAARSVPHDEDRGGDAIGAADEGPVADEGPAGDGGPVGDEARAGDHERADAQPDRLGDEPEAGGAPDPDNASVFEVDVPPSALGPLGGEEFDADADDDDLPAEAAHARRTMIGRSAEEVDHAPPRGRYAPVPAPQSSGAGGTLRWIAPAAALALASAVVVGRALRRRK